MKITASPSIRMTNISIHTSIPINTTIQSTIHYSIYRSTIINCPIGFERYQINRHAAKCESYALVFAKSELGLVSYDDYKFIPLPSVGYDPFETALDLRMVLLSSLCCLKGCVLPFETKIAHKSRYRSLKFSEFNAKSVFSPALAFFCLPA